MSRHLSFCCDGLALCGYGYEGCESICTFLEGVKSGATDHESACSSCLYMLRRLAVGHWDRHLEATRIAHPRCAGVVKSSGNTPCLSEAKFDGFCGQHRATE